MTGNERIEQIIFSHEKYGTFCRWYQQGTKITIFNLRMKNRNTLQMYAIFLERKGCTIMKRVLSLTILMSMILLLLSACESTEDHTGEAKTPSGSSVMKGRNYEDVVNDFKEKGFTNIKLEQIDDLIFGWLTKEGEVEEVSVGGNVDYSPDQWVSADTEVIIKYHVFPQSDETQAEHPTQDETQGEQPSSEGTVQNTESGVEDDILTVENCEDLANILSLKSEIDPAYADFADKYKGMTIEFDGRIDYVANHDNYDTRYDILLSAGDYDSDTQIGPTFKFENVAAYQLNLQTMFLEEEITVGKNVRITAIVVSFNSDTGIFLLEPISVVAR